MKKSCFFLAGLLMTCLASNAQAYNTNIAFMNSSRPAVAIELPYAEEMVEKALKQRLESAGLKRDGSKKGVTNYKEVVLNEIKAQKLDLYTKVDKKEKDKSIVYIMASNGYDNFISPLNDSIATEKMKGYLNGMLDVAYNFGVSLDIKKQEDVVNDNEKKLTRLLNDQKDLEKRKEKLEKDIMNNAADIQNQQKSLEVQRQVLSDLTAKKKTL